MRRRALVVCPGRGSYSREGLGQLKNRGAQVADMLDVCDAFRAQNDRPTLREIDGAETYRSNLHVAGENASLLTFACTLADFMSIDAERYEVVGVTGNSMGWYTALAASGAMSLEQAVELVDTMGAYQAGNVIGGQVLTPACSESVVAGQLEDPAQVEAIDAVLRACTDAGHVAVWSIRLGGYAVLGADKAGVKYLLEHLPHAQRGANVFPMQLPLHSAFHTSLLEATAAQARKDLSHLDYQPPVLPLIDGRGRVYRPFHADPAELAWLVEDLQRHRQAPDGPVPDEVRQVTAAAAGGRNQRALE